jgi:MOSC domain-containing protein YiiM
VSVVVAVSRNGTYAFSKPVREEIMLVAGLGVEGDAHAGTTVKHRSRVRSDPSQPNLRQVHLLAAELFDEVRQQGYEVAPGQLGENVTTRGIDLLRLPAGTILRFGRPPASAADPAEPGGAAALSGIMAAARTATLSTETAAALAAVTAAAERDAHHPPADAHYPPADAHHAPADAPDARPAVIVAGLRNPCAQINGLRPGLLGCVLSRDEAGNPVRKAGVMGVVLRGGRVVPGDPVAVDLPPRPHVPLERV